MLLPNLRVVKRVVIRSEWKRQEPLVCSKDVVAKASYLSFCSLMATATDGRERRLDCVGALFHQSHFDWGQNRIRPGEMRHVRSGRESHSNGYLKVDSLTHALPDLREPNSGISTVNQAA